MAFSSREKMQDGGADVVVAVSVFDTGALRGKVVEVELLHKGVAAASG